MTANQPTDEQERVARSIHEARRGTEMYMDETWEELLALDALTPDEENDAYFELERARKDARAAIAALSTPPPVKDTDLQAEIERLREALRWYAGDGSTYDGIDVGQRARAALSEQEPK